MRLIQQKVSIKHKLIREKPTQNGKNIKKIIGKKIGKK
jgi:hypothetical protein